MSVDYENEFDYTLESILAEYKSNAFINGEKKTSKEEMDDAVSRIIDEVKHNISSQQDGIPQSGADAEENVLETDEPEAVIQDGTEAEQLTSKAAVSDREETGDEIFDELIIKSLDVKRMAAQQELLRAQEAARVQSEPEPAEELPAQEPEPEEEEPAGNEPEPEGPETQEPVEYDLPQFEPRQAPAAGDVRDAAPDTYDAEPEQVSAPRRRRRAGRKTRRSIHAEETPTADVESVSEDDFEDIEIIQQPDQEQYAQPDYDQYAQQTGYAIEEEEEYEDSGAQIAGRIISTLYRIRHKEVDDEDEPLPEPDYTEAKERFEVRFEYFTWRIFLGMFFSCVLAFFTLLYEAGLNLPFGMDRQIPQCAAVMLILQLAVMLLGLDIIASGTQALLRGKADVRSVVAAASFMTVLSCAECMLGFEWEAGLPFCAVSSFATVFAMWGERLYARGYAETLRTLTSIREPKGVCAGFSDNIEKTVLKKFEGYTDGFYNNMVQSDVSESGYKLWAPMLLIICVVLSLLLSVVHTTAVLLPQFLSATLSVAAGFSGLLAFSLPYAKAARQLRKSGNCIAGWGGADDICCIDGARMTDEDVFPPGTVKIEGVKVFKDVSTEKAIRYTSSLVSQSQSGLSRVFEEMARNQQITLVRVEDFSCYEGGIGGSIRGDKVLSGSGAFMALMGIHIPESMNITNAVYTAVNNKLICVFAMSYKPKMSVRNAIIDILHGGVKLFFAVRDFNITPLMLMQKFKIELDGIEYMPIDETYDISQKVPNGDERTCAVIFRDGLGSFGEVIMYGRRLKAVSKVCTAVSVGGSLLGLFLVFVLMLRGTAMSVSAGNVMLFLLSVLIIVCLLSGFVKNRR